SGAAGARALVRHALRRADRLAVEVAHAAVRAVFDARVLRAARLERLRVARLVDRRELAHADGQLRALLLRVRALHAVVAARDGDLFAVDAADGVRAAAGDLVLRAGLGGAGRAADRRLAVRAGAADAREVEHAAVDAEELAVLAADHACAGARPRVLHR